MPARADLALKLRVVLQLHRIDLQRIVTLLVAANHRVPIEARQRSPCAQTKIVARPLQHALLVDHAARQRHAGAHYRDLVLRLQRQVLFDERAERERRRNSGEP